MNAYNKIYLEDAMHNLGVMLDYGTMAVGDSARFFDMFIVSGIARQFGNGNPKYIVGMSGIELANAVIEQAGGMRPSVEYVARGRSASYWAGWALAYLQWHLGKSFERIVESGMGIERILSMYGTYHEADITRFVADSVTILSENTEKSRLKYQRRLINMTQKELSDRSGVKLRMIQAYEQNYQDISKAEVSTIVRLARVLSCRVEDLLQ